MNLYLKLTKARTMLQNTELKKSGRNAHLKFDYFELQDFLPTINDINLELGICTNFNLCDNTASLTIINAEEPTETLVFNIVTAQAKLQGNASPIQEIGSLITYCRRYLYINAYEISENDVLDGQIGSPAPQKNANNTNTPQTNKTPTEGITEAQGKRLFAIMNQNNKTKEELVAYTTEHFKKSSSKELNQIEYKKLCNWIEGK